MNNLPYFLLGASVCLCLFTRSRVLMVAGILASLLTAFSQGLIQGDAVGFLLLLGGISFAYYRQKNLSPLVRVVFFAAIICLMAGFFLHKIPGFSNLLVIQNAYFSENSLPFSMYLNFDKVMAALILYTASPLAVSEEPMDGNAFSQVFIILIGCILTLLGPAFFLGQIHYAPKIPEVSWLWALNNLLFVCFAEEVFFRGFIQNNLKPLFPPAYKMGAVFLAALIFGAAHFQGGGIPYMALAAVAGLFYGYAYERTHRIFAAMLVHFGLNLCHFFLFSYPALAPAH